MPISNKKLENLIGFAIALAAFILYWKTLCPTTDFIDAGELTTVAYTLGIAHPTGYPLFTLLGWLFSHLPIGDSVVYRMNLMAAFFCATAIFIFFRLFLSITQKLLDEKESREAGWLRLVPATAGTIALACSETFWSQATAVEVYSLHTIFLALLLLIFTRLIDTERRASEEGIPKRRWQLFAFLLGLAFTNHMTTILLAPAFLIYFFIAFGKKERTWKLLAQLIVPFALGLSLYLYLPLRAGEHPLLNWGNTVEPERLWWHFTGKQYRVWIFESSDSAMKQLTYFLSTLGPKFVWLPLVLALLGIRRLFRRDKFMALFTALLFVGCVAYAINYDIHDIDSYFLLAYVTVALWAAVGTLELLSFMKSVQSRRFIAGALIVILCAGGAANYSDADESNNRYVEKYTADMFASVAPGALLISYQWDYFVSAAYYFQIVGKVRPDVVVVDKELLRRSWYYEQMKTRFPELYRTCEPEIKAFLVELAKFEHDLPYDGGTIEMRYNRVIHALIEKSMASRPVYVTGEIEEPYTRGYSRVPSGLAFRLVVGPAVGETIAPSFEPIRTERHDQYVDGMRAQYAKSYLNYSLYMHLQKKDDVAVQFLNKAMEIDPTMAEGMALRDELGRGR